MRKLTDKEFLKLNKEFLKQYDRGKHQRIGQAYFNALHEVNSKLATEITGTEFDCFYDDNKLIIFIRDLIGE